MVSFEKPGVLVQVMVKLLRNYLCDSNCVWSSEGVQVQLSTLPGFMDLPELWLCLHCDQAGLVPTGQGDQPATAGRKWNTAGGKRWHQKCLSSLSKPASQGSTGIRISMLFHCFLLLAQAVYFTLWGQGQFELLGLCQQLLFFHMTVVAVDCLNWHLCRSPVQVLCWLPCTKWLCTPLGCQDGQEEVASCQHSPMGWGNQSLNHLWQQSAHWHALQGCRWFLIGIFRVTWTRKLSACPQGELLFEESSQSPVSRLTVVQWIWGLEE